MITETFHGHGNRYLWYGGMQCSNAIFVGEPSEENQDESSSSYEVGALVIVACRSLSFRYGSRINELPFIGPRMRISVKIWWSGWSVCVSGCTRDDISLRFHWFSVRFCSAHRPSSMMHPCPGQCCVLYTVLYKDWFPLNQRKMKTVFRPFTSAFRFARVQAASRFTHSRRSINNIVCLYYYRSADICGLNGCF